MKSITYFPNIYDSANSFYKSHKLALKRIKNGASKDLVNKIRTLKDKSERDKLKAKLPCICFSGQFHKRNNASLRTHSGLICLDFDNVGREFKESLKQDNFIYSAFISPSGNGVKALVKLPNFTERPEEMHHASFLALQEIYKELDISCKDVARVCYESFDPEIYINEDSEIFTKQIFKKIETYEVENPETDLDKIYEFIKKWLDDKGEYFTEGNRNNFLCKISAACNHFGIDQNTCRSYLIYDFVNGSSNFQLSELDSVIKSIYSRYSHQFATAQFQKKEIVSKETKHKLDIQILDLKVPAKDVIYAKDVKADILHEFENGVQKGSTTGLLELDEIFRWNKGELTCLYGIGNHGKSNMMLDLVMRKCVKDNWKWAIFSPENFPARRFYRDFVQNYIGKPVMGQNKMSKEELSRGVDFVNDHIYFLYPKEDDPTPEYINQRFFEVIAKHKVDGVIVDPFNQMYHKGGSSADPEYLSRILREFKNFSLREQVVYLVIAHTNGKIESEEGVLSTPYYIWQLAGGMMWGNKCDNILCYHRPNYKINPLDTSCLLQSQKIKNQMITGKPGKVDLDFDINTLRYSVNQTYFDSSGSKTQIKEDYRDKFIMDTEKDLDLQSNISPNLDFFSAEDPF